MFLEKITDKRWKRLALFTIGWLIVCFGGAEVILGHPKYNLEKGYWLVMGWAYFIALLPVASLDIYGTRKGYKSLYFLSLLLLALTLYPIWGRILFELNDSTGKWFSYFLKVLEEIL